MPHMKRTVKDSVFTYLFQDPQYTLQLYKSLHGEDDDVEEKDIEVVTLANVMTNDLYNDLGFLVKDRLIILVEAQSTFSPNLAYRMHLYSALTFKNYADENKLDSFGTKKMPLPLFEPYVIYTGDQNVPDTLRLSDLYIVKGRVRVETEVQVLRGDAADKSDIVNQYVRFCKIADEERRKSGPTVETVKRIIDRCIEEGVLPVFLASRRREVEDIMVVLYDEAKVREIHEYNVRKDALKEGVEKGIELGMSKGRAEGMKRGRAEGMKKGMEKGRDEGTEKGISAVVDLMKRFTVEKSVAAQEVAQRFDLTPEAAAAKVEQYWN